MPLNLHLEMCQAPKSLQFRGLDDWTALEIDGDRYRIFVASEALKPARLWVKERCFGSIRGLQA